MQCIQIYILQIITLIKYINDPIIKLTNFICNSREISPFTTKTFPYSYVITKVTITSSISDVETSPSLRLTDIADYQKSCK